MALLMSGCTSSGNDATIGGTINVKIKIIDAEGKALVDKTIPMDKSADGFSALKAATTVTYQDTAYGPFITGIAGVDAGNDNYWALYVNGEYADKGVNQYKLEEDTTIEWKLEKVDLSQFG
ncbi:MAG: DUF4430 domain-containing protein [Candidatus Diapherotrites archaeon]